MIDGLSAVFLVCFGFGFIMVLLSMLTGVGHLSFHLGDLHIHFGHVGHADLHGGSPAIGHIAHASDGATPFNAMSILTFITWFGGIGYLLHGPFGVWGGVSALAALLAGLAAAALVFRFLARVLLPQSVPLDPADYLLEGQVGRVSSPIRADGVGEIIYSQRGRRRAMGARSATGVALPHDAEVVIVAVKGGLALVEPWEQFVNNRPGDHDDSALKGGALGVDLPATSGGKEQGS